MLHNSLEAAISWAPEFALQELARYIGLDYDKIISNVENYETLRSRSLQKRRALVDQPVPSKRERLKTPEQTARAKPSDRAGYQTSEPSEVIGWDTRVTEDRTPDSQRPHVKDVPHARRPTLSPTSVATSGGELPIRGKR